MTSKVVAPPPSWSRPPPDPPPRKLPLFEPLQPPDPLDPPDASLVPDLLWFISTTSIRCLSSAFHPAVLLSLCFICPCPSRLTSLDPDLSSTAWTSSCREGSRQTSGLKTLCHALSFSSPRTMTVLPSGKIYFTWFWSMNLPSDDQRTHLCSPETSLITTLADHNDQRLSFDSRKSVWFHHGNAGVDRFFWELRHIPSEIGVNPILLFAGVEKSRSLMWLRCGFSKNLWLRRGNIGGRSLCLTSATASFSQCLLDFTDQRLDVGSVKSPWLQHGNAGVRISCLNSTLALSESIDKPISLSYVNVKSLEVHIFFFGAISGVNSKCPSKALHQRHTSTSANIKPSFLLGWSLLKLEDCSPLAFSLSKKASQTSSCRGHERSLSIFLLFVGLKSSIKTPLCVRYFSFGWIIDDVEASSSHLATASNSFVTSPLIAETLAMRKAITSALDKRIISLLIHSDSQVFIKLLKSMGRNIEIVASLIDIYLLFTSFIVIQFKFFSRANMVKAVAIEDLSVMLLV
ncbi:Uncharacterized protein Rs2_45976 [Raphanus sativus]|nr:Uncharacterized protein Rs2_45976 [Raphanus sativus]